MNTTNEYWENLYEQATEELSHYRWALEEWLEQRHEHSDTYLLLEIFKRREHSRRIIDKLNDAPESYTTYTQKLKKGFAQAEGMLNDFLKDKERIKAVLQESVPEILLNLNKKLDRIKGSYENAILFEDRELLREEFPEIAMSFLNTFTSIYYILNAYQLEDIKTLKEQFEGLAKRLKDIFHYFIPVAEILADIRKSLLPFTEWWYTTDPKTYMPTQIKIHLVPVTDIKRTPECPSYETLISYAFNDLTFKEELALEKHIDSCDYCLNEIITLRYAEDAIPEEPVFKPIPSESETVDKKIVEWSRLIEAWLAKKIENILKRGLFVPPQWTAVTTAGDSTVQEDSLRSFYILTVTPENGQITILKRPQDEENELKPLCKSIYRETFYYKIYGVYGEKDIMEILSGKDEYLPLKVKISDPDILIVFIGKNKDNLDNNSTNLINIIKEDKYQEIKDIVCLLVKIKKS